MIAAAAGMTAAIIAATIDTTGDGTEVGIAVDIMAGIDAGTAITAVAGGNGAITIACASVDDGLNGEAGARRLPFLHMNSRGGKLSRKSSKRDATKT